jgi:hypothetical protein
MEQLTIGGALMFLKKNLIIIIILFVYVNGSAYAEPLDDAKKKLLSCFSEEMIRGSAKLHNVSEEFVRGIIQKTPDLLNQITDMAEIVLGLHSVGKENEVEYVIKQIDGEIPGASDELIKCYESYKNLISEVELGELAVVYDGPFGLMFGQSSEDIEYEYLHEVDLNSPNGGGYSCQNSILSVSDFMDIQNLPPSPFDISDNALGADFSARLFAGMYSIPIQGGFSKVCLAFFDDRLFMINIQYDQYKRYYDILKAGIDQKYVFHNSSLFKGGTFLQWKSSDNLLSIELIVSDTGGELDYVYNLIKLEQVQYVIDTYMKHYNNVGEITDF